jgi:hypothetical protein
MIESHQVVLYLQTNMYMLKVVLLDLNLNIKFEFCS